MDITQYLKSEMEKANFVVDEEKAKRFEIQIDNCKEMDSKQKEAVIDEISVRQPYLMHEITDIKKLGAPEDVYNDILDLLIILYSYFSDGGKTELPVITEKIIKEVNANLDAYLEWQKKEDPEEMMKLMVKLFFSHQELFAFGWVNSYMTRFDIDGKTPGGLECIRSGRFILDCFMKVKGRNLEA